ncbi:MAG: hypothetical protein HY328_19040 [Chloroflexi bacterium]|nr:hypothetical protein [Chloroflexota bacterium]
MQHNRLQNVGTRLVWLLLAGLVLSACHGFRSPSQFERPAKVGANPPIELTLAPTYTPTVEPQPTVLPTETPTAAPTEIPTATPTEVAASAPVAEQPATTATATPRPTRARPTATSTPKPTPIVVIPNGFTKQTDSVRGYSLALPRGYTTLDLRSAQFRNLANAVGMGDRMTALNEFLDSPAGQIVGILAASDLAGMIFGGLPTIAQVMVVDAVGANQETAQISVEGLLSGQGGFLSNPVIEKMESVTINNLPGVRASVTGNLAGANRPMAGKVVGLLANEKFYVLIQLTEASKRTAKEPIFDQIIGTFRPE